MKIIGTGRALPKHTVTNDMLSEILDTSDEWIVPRTGIHTRQVITDETLQELSCAAACQALSDSGLKPEEIDFIICSNVANNYITPAMSAFIQEATGCTCPFFDINGACAGFIDALDIADAFMQSGRAQNVLIVAAEEVTKFCNWEQRETSVLFGDGAGAAVVQKDDVPCYTVLTGDSHHKGCITYLRPMEKTPYEKDGMAIHQPMIMKGRDVFRMAVTTSPRDLRNVIAKAGMKPEDVTFFLVHQANKRIVDAIRENLNLPEEKFPTIIDHTGNTSSASIPLLIDEVARQGRFKKGDVLALSAFGAGFVTAAAILTWGK
ncbi:MAG: beta-ketoacyl-ACP synthase 3 [Bacteroidales bacterium]|nr:beta-ketoacyl-ACP synthase 3 [Bacteroidales bacterium]